MRKIIPTLIVCKQLTAVASTIKKTKDKLVPKASKMKWSSNSNSSLSNGSVVTIALNNSNNNNSSMSSSGSNTSSNYGHNGIIRSAATVRRHESDRRSIFYTDPQDMEIFLKNRSNKKVR